MSFHDQSRELSLLNREAYLAPVKVHPWTYAVLKRAQRMHYASQGLFDCTVADALIQWQLLPKHAFHPEPLNCSQAQLELLPDHHVYYRSPIALDLGGIAKGFAVDAAIQCLRQRGICSAVVNAGGDLRVLGTAPESIMLRDPKNPQQLQSIGELSQGSVATSSIYYSQRQYQSQRVSALVDPATRQPILTPHSFSVIAPLAWAADALTKVVAVSANPNHPCLRHFSAAAFILLRLAFKNVGGVLRC